MPFLTLGYGKKNIRERRGERERGEDCYVGRRDGGTEQNYIKHLYKTEIVQKISSSSSSITKL